MNQPKIIQRRPRAARQLKIKNTTVCIPVKSLRMLRRIAAYRGWRASFAIAMAVETLRVAENVPARGVIPCMPGLTPFERRINATPGNV